MARKWKRIPGDSVRKLGAQGEIELAKLEVLRAIAEELAELNRLRFREESLRAINQTDGNSR